MIQFVGRKCLEHGQGCGEQGWQGALGRLLEEVMCEPRLEGGEGVSKERDSSEKNYSLYVFKDHSQLLAMLLNHFLLTRF